MRVPPPWDRRRRPNTDDQALPLINVAFLLLVFFLLAGTMLPPEPFTVDELQVREGESAKPAPDRLVMATDGRLAYGGRLLDLADLTPELLAGHPEPLPIQVDAQADAGAVVTLLQRLRRTGVEQVRLVGVAYR